MMALAACGKDKADNDDQNIQDETITWPTQPPLPAVGGEVTFNLTASATDNYVNVMGTTVPRMPNFPQIKQKPGRVRGFTEPKH